MHWISRRTIAAWTLLAVVGLWVQMVSSSHGDETSEDSQTVDSSDSKQAYLASIANDKLFVAQKKAFKDFIQQEKSCAKTARDSDKRSIIRKYNLSDLLFSQKTRSRSSSLVSTLSRLDSSRPLAANNPSLPAINDQLSGGSKTGDAISDISDINCAYTNNYMFIAWAPINAVPEFRPVLVRGRYWGAEPDLDAVAALKSHQPKLLYVTILNTRKSFDQNIFKTLQTEEPKLIYHWNEAHYKNCMTHSWGVTALDQRDRKWTTKLKDLFH